MTVRKATPCAREYLYAWEYCFSDKGPREVHGTGPHAISLRSCLLGCAASARFIDSGLRKKKCYIDKSTGYVVFERP